MSDVREVVIVGGGLAGLSAALSSARLGRRTTILTGGVPGGQLVSINKIEGVPGFPDGVAGYDLCPITQEQADKAGVEFSMAGCDALVADGDGWRVASTEGDILARAVIVATGTERAMLGVPGEDAPPRQGCESLRELRCATVAQPGRRGGGRRGFGHAGGPDPGRTRGEGRHTGAG